LTEKSIRKAKFSGSLVNFSAAVSREKLVLAGGLRRLGSVVGESAAAAEKSSEESAVASVARRSEDVSQEIELTVDKAGIRCEQRKGQNNFTRKLHFASKKL
jgi:hypothetical protein